MCSSSTKYSYFSMPSGNMSFMPPSFLREIWPIQRSGKKAKVTKTCPKKKKDRPRVNTIEKNADLNSPNWTGYRSDNTSNHDLPFVGHISWWVPNWSVQLMCLQDCLHQFSPWSGTLFFFFGAVTQMCRPKMSPKMGKFRVLSDIWASLSRILRLFGPAILHYCATVMGSNFQVLTCSG